jgi:hypothetical protein
MSIVSDNVFISKMLHKDLGADLTVCDVPLVRHSLGCEEHSIVL